jgi:23S rRNA (uracil1939-C5)-methyltransferase
VLTPGQIVELSVEKAAAGGRMLARHDGQVVLVAGAVPGERVAARIERTERRLAFAAVVDVTEASPDRRLPFADPACGGCVYSHIDYARQLELKADIVRDAFLRLGKLPLDGALHVAASPERGYRTRARLHVEGTRVGFYREGTHTLCDAAATMQLSDRAMAAATAAAGCLVAGGATVRTIELTENLDASEVALALTVGDVREIQPHVRRDLTAAAGVKGCVVRDESGRSVDVGEPSVIDPLSALSAGRARSGILRHRPDSFFQANRFLVPALVTGVLDAAAGDDPVLDLYAGVGLFAIALAATARREVTAVEGDAASGADLEENAAQPDLPAGAVSIARDSVERYLLRRARRAPAPATVIVDPPRTGLTSDAVQSILALGPSRLVYVSCDPPTMARDARRLLDGGYRLESLRGFDFFPNTPHVESLGVFVKSAASA